jgi:hypothetical protein
MRHTASDEEQGETYDPADDGARKEAHGAATKWQRQPETLHQASGAHELAPTFSLRHPNGPMKDLPR